MNDNDECRHGMLAVTCATCKHGPLRLEPLRVTGRMVARYSGECRDCGLPISLGQVISRLSDDSYCHYGCEPLEVR